MESSVSVPTPSPPTRNESPPSPTRNESPLVPVLNNTNKGLEQSNLEHNEDRAMNEVQDVGGGGFDLDLYSFTVDEFLDTDTLVQQLESITKKRQELQQMEIQLRAMIIARKQIMGQQKSSELLLTDNGNAGNMAQYQPEEASKPSPVVTDLPRRIVKASSSISSNLMEHSQEQSLVHSGSSGQLDQNSPNISRARKLLFRRMLVGVNDGRFFMGAFHCIDKQGNIILQDAIEFRSARRSSPSPMEQRCLGLILIPSSCRSSCHVDCSIEEQLSLLSLKQV